MQTTEQNKNTVTRFNHEVIEQGNLVSFKELVADTCINHTAPAGASNGPDGMIYFLLEVLRKGFPDLKVEIHDQIAEGDKVTTRKTIHATHSGNFMGVAATGKKVKIEIIDIIRLKDGKYVDHWGMSNLHSLVSELSGLNH